MEQCYKVYLTPTGFGAVFLAVLSVVEPGDEILVTDSVYSPTRLLTQDYLRKFDVKSIFYDPKNFEDLKNIPQAWNRDLLDLILGSHDPSLQKEINEIRPVKVFNLSITPPEVIESTHERMSKCYHSDGGPWSRNYMPRTLMVFVNDEQNLSETERTKAAKEEAEKSLSSYWGALEGTIDPMKVSKAADNSVIGNVEEVAQQIAERFHPDDCIMAWFDFFNHDSPRVIRNMDAFMNKVVPRVEELIS